MKKYTKQLGRGWLFLRTDNRVLLVTEIKGSKSGQTHRFLEVGWFKTNTEEISHGKEKFEKFCESGCSNFGNNGGCPPYAPNFARLQKIYRNALVLWVRMPIWECPEDLLDKADKNFYFVAQYAQAVLPPVIGRVRQGGKELWDPDFILGESACKKCKPCAFNDKTKEESERMSPEEKVKKIKCNNPKDRMYSLESTGVDVDMLMRVGSFPIYWFPTGEPIRNTPYTIKSIAFLYKGDFPDHDFTQGICDILNGRDGWSARRFDDILGVKC